MYFLELNNLKNAILNHGEKYSFTNTFLVEFITYSQILFLQVMSNTAKTVLGIIIVIIVVAIIILATKSHDDTSVAIPAQTTTQTAQATNPSTSSGQATSVDTDLGNIDAQMTGLQSDTATANTTTP